MKQNLMKKTAVLTGLFLAVSLTAIIYTSAHKVITIEGVAQDEVQETVTEIRQSADASGTLIFRAGGNEGNYLQIPLPAGCKAADIAMENHYLDRELRIVIPGVEKEFYAENSLSGNRDNVIMGRFDSDEEKTVLNLKMNGVYECKTIFENDSLYINFMTPQEAFEKVVVIDPACGGRDAGITHNDLLEKDIALQVAKCLKEKLDSENIKAYYTRMDDVNPTTEERISLGNGTRADLYIRIEVGEEKDTSVYGTKAVYNRDYFIPAFGNLELADCLEREVTLSVKGKALGLEAAGERDEVLNQLAIPGAAIRVGILSNAQEAALLGREDYCEKIAAGIFNAIKSIYEQYDI